MAYLVKFLSEDVTSPTIKPAMATVKLGTFKHYREIEDVARMDCEEGQRGLDLLIRRPSKRLDELIVSSAYTPPYSNEHILPDGTFGFEYHVMNYEYLYDFNAWIFCCSIIENLSDIPKLAQRFGASHYYFISDGNAFIQRTMQSLALDLQTRPLRSDGKERIPHPKNGKVFLDIHKGIVVYSDEETKYTRLTVDTLEQFYEKHLMQLSFDLMRQKSKRFSEDKEFRIIYFATESRGGSIFTTNDDSIILSIDLSGIISAEPIPIS